MKLTVLLTKCWWGNISNHTISFSQMKPTSIVLLSGDHGHGHPTEIVPDDGISLFGATGKE
jgi:hypothetical protein